MEFIGRKEHLEKLRRLFSSVKEGVGATVFIYGEAGVGKYALVEKLAEELKDEIVFVSHRFVEDSAKPYGGFIEILEKLGEGGCAHSEKALNFLKGKDRAKNIEEIFDTVASSLKKCAEEKVLLIAFDNMHWADRESIQLFKHVAKHVPDSRILLIGTYVMEKLAPIDGEDHPLMVAMGEMMAENLFTTIHVEPFTPQETEMYIEALLGSPPPKPFVFAVYSATKGNPLFIKEMLEDLKKRGVINPSDPEWAKKIDLKKVSMIPTVAETLKQKLNDLAPEERNVIELIALMGANFSDKIAEKVLGMENVFNTVISLIEKRLVDKNDGGYALHHTLLGEIILQEMSEERKKALNEKIAHALSEAGGDPFFVAKHAHEASMWEVASENFVRAAEDAYAKYAYETALKMALLAVEDSEKCGKNDVVIRAKIILGKIYQAKGDWDRAIETFSEVAAIDTGELGAEASLLLGHIARNRSQWDEAAIWYSKAVSLAGEKPHISAEANRGLGKIWWRKGDMDKALFYTKRAIEKAREAGDPRILGASMIDAANIYHDTGQRDKAIEQYQKAIDYLSKHGVWDEVARAYNNMGEVYKEHGDLEKAVWCYNRSIENAEKGKNERTRAYAMGNAGECYARMGNIEKAVEYCDTARAFFEKIGEKYVLASMEMVYGMIYDKKGEWKKAKEKFEKSIKELEELGIKYDMGLALHEYGRALMRRGEKNRAEEVLRKALAVFREVKADFHASVVEKELRSLENDRDTEVS